MTFLTTFDIHLTSVQAKRNSTIVTHVSLHMHMFLLILVNIGTNVSCAYN